MGLDGTWENKLFNWVCAPDLLDGAASTGYTMWWITRRAPVCDTPRGGRRGEHRVHSLVDDAASTGPPRVLASLVDDVASTTSLVYPACALPFTMATKYAVAANTARSPTSCGASRLASIGDGTYPTFAVAVAASVRDSTEVSGVACTRVGTRPVPPRRARVRVRPPPAGLRSLTAGGRVRHAKVVIGGGRGAAWGGSGAWAEKVWATVLWGTGRGIPKTSV